MFDELQLADIGIGLTCSSANISEKYDNVNLPDAKPQLEGPAENCKEILVLASYMARTWQTIQTPPSRMGDPRRVTSDLSRSGAVGPDSALPPPVKYNRGVRKSK